MIEIGHEFAFRRDNSAVPRDGVAGWERATTAIGLRHAAIAKLGCQASLYIAQQHVARADLIGMLSKQQPSLDARRQQAL
jgi:hypothetical protein